MWSLSARRAWIEIPAGCWRDARRAVALRKESVDRNTTVLAALLMYSWSLSARRAWIEILIILYAFIGVLVALRKESVDRNIKKKKTQPDKQNVALRKESVDRNFCHEV